MSFSLGLRSHVNDPKLSKSYCEGRKAAADGSASSVNPHASGTTESITWLRGFNTWKSTGTVVKQDACCTPSKTAAPVLAATVDGTDSLKYDFAVGSTLPCTIFFGDGSFVDTEDGTASHTYAAVGTYKAYAVLNDIAYTAIDVTVVYEEEE